jgi:hypothetical protein
MDSHVVVGFPKPTTPEIWEVFVRELRGRNYELSTTVKSACLSRRYHRRGDKYHTYIVVTRSKYVTFATQRDNYLQLPSAQAFLDALDLWEFKFTD